MITVKDGVLDLLMHPNSTSSPLAGKALSEDDLSTTVGWNDANPRSIMRRIGRANFDVTICGGVVSRNTPFRIKSSV
jgi:hypothetical protein